MSVGSFRPSDVNQPSKVSPVTEQFTLEDVPSTAAWTFWPSTTFASVEAKVLVSVVVVVAAGSSRNNTSDMPVVIVIVGEAVKVVVAAAAVEVEVVQLVECQW